MKKTLKTLLVVCVIFAAGWIAWKHYFPKSVIHYRLDVMFKVDGVPVTGSAVQELVVSRVRGLSQKQASWIASGEAVIVDLPDHGTVFVLLTSPTERGTYTGSTKGRFDDLVYHACNLKEKRVGKNWDDFVRMIAELSGSCDVPSQNLPLMVRFEDETDPTSIERVFPEKPEESLGPGIHFLGASITITDAPITTGIGDRLNWLSNFPEPSLEGGQPSANPPFAQIIRHGDFKDIRM